MKKVETTDVTISNGNKGRWTRGGGGDKRKEKRTRSREGDKG